MEFKQLCLVLLLSFTSFCIQNTSKGAAMAANSTDGPQGQREVRTTAYARSRHCTSKNANGSHLRAGDLMFNICGTHKTFVVDDYGPALVGTNKIDLYMPSRREMHHWGVRKVTINIIEPGSCERSLALLKPRKHLPYVRRMVKVLEEKV
jgi:hypothetical protein